MSALSQVSVPRFSSVHPPRIVTCAPGTGSGGGSGNAGARTVVTASASNRVVPVPAISPPVQVKGPLTLSGPEPVSVAPVSSTLPAKLPVSA
jgi:hypothetical protein